MPLIHALRTGGTTRRSYTIQKGTLLHRAAARPPGAKGPQVWNMFQADTGLRRLSESTV